MATITVSIPYEGTPTYSPDNIIKLGDKVEFVLVNRTDEVTIDFNNGCPLTDNHFGLNGASLTGGNHSTHDVSNTITTRHYAFTVNPVGGLRFGENSEAKGTVHGDLDADADNPPEEG